ncbi:MAG TPA: BrnT family toxin [Gammaproteobacteria bacterium]|nr:BrnT family toxin [Gammaproteobacteria bacterium]
MLFEWEDEKDRINRRKHDMPLKAGISDFDDINAIEFEDNRYNYSEKRWVLIGHDSRTKLLCVVYTMKEVTRLISVRKAIKKERDLYYKGGY